MYNHHASCICTTCLTTPEIPMIQTQISESPQFAGSFILTIIQTITVWLDFVAKTREYTKVIPCHNLSTAKYLERCILAGHGIGDVSEAQEGKEDTSHLRTTVIHGKFYGSYIVLVFDDADNLVNEIPCRDSRTARLYRDNPTIADLS